MGASTWLIGWGIFAVVEIMFRCIKGPPLLPFVSLLILIAYSGLGIAAGVTVSGAATFLMKITGKELPPIKLLCLLMVSCVATIVIFYGGVVVTDQFLSTAPDVIHLVCTAGAILVYLLLLVGLYVVFVKRADRTHLFSSFLALLLSVDLFMVGGLYSNETLLPGRFIVFSLRNTAANFGMFIGCIVLYFLLYACFSFLGSRLSTMKHHLSLKRALAGLVVMAIVAGSIWYSNSRTIFEGPASDVPGKHNVILITMDTTRADHLSCYGYHRKTTPAIDAFAKEAVLFKNVYTTAPWTLPAHASIFTGMYPAQHGATINSDFTEYLLARYGTALKGARMHAGDVSQNTLSLLSKENVTLAEILSANGFNTAGIIGGPACSSLFGLGQGFAFYDNTLYDPDYDVAYFTLSKIMNGFIPLTDFLARYGIAVKGKTASQVNDVAFNWLGKNYKQPFFLFLNYFDPHTPYFPPIPFSNLFAGGNKHLIKNFTNQNGKAGFIHAQDHLIGAVLSRKQRLSTIERDVLLSQYDGEIRYVDYHINRLFQTLKRLNVYDNTMIIITSDHGELFGSHDSMIHGLTLYQGELQIPLIIKYPSSQPTGVIEESVSLVDILPTVVASLGFSVPEDVQGEVLPGTQRPIIAEYYNNWVNIRRYGNHFNRDLKAFYDWPFKFIWESNGKCELYNIEEDPYEVNNVVKEMPGKAGEMQALLDTWLASVTPVAPSISPEIDRTTEESLRALGYLP